MKTAGTAVQAQGRISSLVNFINLICQPKNSFAVLLTILMAWMLAAEIYNKFQQPVDTRSLVIYGIFYALIIFFAWFIASAFKTLSETILSAMVAVVFSTSIASAIMDSQGASAEIRTLTTTILFVIFFFLTDRLWVKGRRYFPAYICLLMSILVAIQK